MIYILIFERRLFNCLSRLCKWDCLEDLVEVFGPILKIPPSPFSLSWSLFFPLKWASSFFRREEIYNWLARGFFLRPICTKKKYYSLRLKCTNFPDIGKFFVKKKGSLIIMFFLPGQKVSSNWSQLWQRLCSFFQPSWPHRYVSPKMTSHTGYITHKTTH